MKPSFPPVGEADLDALDDYLLSDETPDDCMMLSDLDGFLTGIAAGPELIAPSEWMPRIFGGAGPGFDEPDRARQILGIILARYNEIAGNLDAGPASFDPIFERTANGQTIVGDWACGFIDAAMLRPAAWAALAADDEMAKVFYAMCLLGTEDPAHPPFNTPPLPAEAMAALHRNGAAVIRDCVYRIQAFWRKTAPKPPRKTRTRTGRPDFQRRRS